METFPGGWTLVYSYTFTNYNSFSSLSNAVTPRPNWPASGANVPISTTPPLSESSLGAVNWNLWKDIGKEFMVKSNINDWVVCQLTNWWKYNQNETRITELSESKERGNSLQWCGSTENLLVVSWTLSLCFLALLFL